jgi:hypothetical protein
VPVVHINDGGYPEAIPHERDSKLIDVSYFHVLVLESMGMGEKKSKSQMICAASFDDITIEFARINLA